jgi:hypothetical protein
LASCSAPTVPVDRPVAVKVEVPAHLEQPAAEPATDPATLRTNGDLMVAFGDWVTWGRTVTAQMNELLRLIAVANAQAGGK